MERKEAIEIVRKLYNESLFMQKDKEAMVTLITELKENEDEESKKWILEYLYDGLRKSDEQFKGQFKAAIAWLEKQDKKDKLIKELGKYKVKYTQEVLSQKLEKQGEPKPTDKVEPKFKVGYFILNGDVTNKGKHEIFKVLKVCSSWYDVENIYDGRQTMITFAQEYTCKRWTIQDANDGDVLYSHDKNLLWIYKDTTTHYASMILDYVQYDCISTNRDIVIPLDTCPATKEQRDLLFQKMKEAGYEWDVERKELRKIDARKNLTLDDDLMQADCMVVDQRHDWSEEDEAGFDDAMWAIEQAQDIAKNENDMGNLWYAKRWLKSIKERMKGN